MSVRKGVNKALYFAWVNMKCRCDSVSSNRYYTHGERGISYDPSWSSYDNFARDMEGSWKEGLTLDRKNNDGNYCKDNCRWATYAEQNQNSRNAKLTAENVQEIRLSAKAGKKDGDLAIRYKVSRKTINNIVKGRSWVEKGG